MTNDNDICRVWVKEPGFIGHTCCATLVNGKCPIHGVGDDDKKHPGLNDGAGIVEQPERFDEFTGAPTTDPASRAIAALTTPGKRHATDPTAEELDTIAGAALRGRDHLEIAVKQYGLRTYGAGMDFTLGLMGKASR